MDIVKSPRQIVIPHHYIYNRTPSSGSNLCVPYVIVAACKLKVPVKCVVTQVPG
jgi:hypothetical protein